MVKVREDHPVSADGSVDIEQWTLRIQAMANLPERALQPLARACQLSRSAEQEAIAVENIWAEGASSFRTGLEMTEMLADLRLNEETLVAAILYRTVREHKVPLLQVQQEFGDTVAKLIKGVLRMAAISSQRSDSDDRVFGAESQEQTEKIRKMLVAMVDDVRVALIKLAERTCAIRAVKNVADSKRLKVAREVAEVYAPLAHRLGIGHIKWELEDLSFRYLKPDEYKNIAHLLDERRVDRQRYIDTAVDLLKRELGDAGIEQEIGGRAKHIYSIWRKMRRKDIDFSEVYDIYAVRILVPTVRDCYSVLGIVHSLWRNIPHEFDDYIASPKENGYRSLHTAVIGPERKVMEIQIRTNSMHEEAEYGVCAHWVYKGTDSDAAEDSYEQKIAWLRQVLEWHEELGGHPLEEDLAQGVEQDRIYIFTPDGHVVDLPRNATPLDFAYRVHTSVGHRCRGAKINGRIVPLNYRLNTADRVEILTGKQESPSRDWLTPSLGYVSSSRARAKIQHWFKVQARDQNIADGQAILDREFKRLALQEFPLDFDELVQKLKLKELDDLYAAVGASDLGVGQVINVVQKLIAKENPPELVVPLSVPAPARKDGSDVYIEGVGNLLTHVAGCCNPVPGDAIIGYVTVGKGVSIHRQDCQRMLQYQTDEPERVLQVEWSDAPQSIYSVDVIIEAFDRHGLLKDITLLLDSERINISSMQTLSNKRKHTVDMQVTMEVSSFNQLSRILARLNQLPNISTARRKR